MINITDYYRGKRGISDLHAFVIFTTRDSKKILKKKHRMAIRKIIRNHQKMYNFTINDLKVRSNYVSMSVRYDPYIGIDKVINVIKVYSARYLKRNYRLNFLHRTTLIPIWSNKYFVTSVGEDINEKFLSEYVNSQKI